MHFELIVDIEFDVLDAAINECLPGYVRAGWVEFTRHSLTPASTMYALSLEKEGDLGDLGRLSVRKVATHTSTLYIEDPKRPTPRDPTPDEWDDARLALLPYENRIRAKLEILSTCRQEAEELFRRRREHQERVVQALFSRLANDSATGVAFTAHTPPTTPAVTPIDSARDQIEYFRSLVERQLHHDLTQNGVPPEAHVRGLLQACITSRSYREVPVRAGRSDIIVVLPEGRLLYETKIWRGQSEYQGGLLQLSEYIKGENSDRGLLGAFYVVFDPTPSHQATAHVGTDHAHVDLSGFPVDVFIVDLSPDVPSARSSA